MSAAERLNRESWEGFFWFRPESVHGQKVHAGLPKGGKILRIAMGEPRAGGTSLISGLRTGTKRKKKEEKRERRCFGR